MNAEQYASMTGYLNESRTRSTTVKTLHDVLPALVYLFYPVQLVYLLITQGLSEQFLKFTLVPLLTLVAITAIRAIINAKRPYEVFDFAPVVEKNTKGKSFPSRHTVSAFIIAMAFLYIQVRLGVVMLVLASLIGATRVLSGVHFVRDVIAGALIGIGIGVVCFFIL